MQLYTGCVENRMDPLKLGRCQVRVVGVHNHNKSELPTEDLPWAYPMQPLTSAAMSGIGFSPVGPVEGTWVVISFRDEPENQHPIIMGTLGGIPQNASDVQEDNTSLVLSDSSGVATSGTQAITDQNGNYTTSGQVSETEQSTTPTYTGARHIRDFSSVSDAGLEIIKKYDVLKLTAYQNVNGVTAIGYGSTSINGKSVASNRKITEADANKILLENIKSIYLPSLKRHVRTLVTQCMVDALVSFCHNMGTSNFSRSTILKELNASRYLNAAAEFDRWVTINNSVSATLQRRRSEEKQLFLDCGIPNTTGGLSPVKKQQTPVGETYTDSNGNQVVSDGMGDKTEPMQVGFKDPKGKYPLYLNEPDTNRLARNEKISETIVFKKDSSRDKDVAIANTDETWEQSKVPYNAKYPFNHVYFSESGHVMEFDDTENSERIHLYHKAGTFTEIDANGTKVTRIVGDGYEILERNGYIHVFGSQHVTVEGAQKTKVVNTFDLEVDGATTINIHNDATVNVKGNAKMAVGKEFALKANSIKMEADTTIDIKSGGNTSIDSSANMYLDVTNNFSVDYARGDFGSGSQAAASTGLSNSSSVLSPQMPSFSNLVVVERSTETSQTFETPEEGDSDAYRARQLESGNLASDEIDTGTQKAETTPEKNAVQPVDQSCDIIFASSSFSPSLVLSTYFSLGDLTSNGSRPVQDQSGLTKQEIVCNLKRLALNVLDPIKEKYPNMVITSAFRRPFDIPGSSTKSQHNKGQAADIVLMGYDRNDHYDAIQVIQQLVPHDQLILEYSGKNTVWIHISYSGQQNRKMIFTMRDHKRVSDIGKFTLIT